jgi:hypothetical protein
VQIDLVVIDDLAYVFNLSARNDDRDEFKIRAKWLYVKWSRRYQHLKVFNDQDKLQYYYTYLNFEPDIKI